MTIDVLVAFKNTKGRKIMRYVKNIFQRNFVGGYIDYLLSGENPIREKSVDGNYEKHLEMLYEEFEKSLKRKSGKAYKDILDEVNDLLAEYILVYAEIGFISGCRFYKEVMEKM